MIEALRVVWGFRRFFGYGVLLLACGWLWFSNNRLEKKLLERELEYTKLSSLVETQNEMILGYESEAAALKKRAEEAMRQAKAADKKHVTKAQRILVEVPTTDDECAATLELLRKYQ